MTLSTTFTANRQGGHRIVNIKNSRGRCAALKEVIIMKKMLVMLLVAIMTLSATALAATYHHDDDIAFEYDDAHFEISMDDHTDDEDLVILTGKDEAWGDTFIRIYLKDLDDGETFPTKDELTIMPGASEVTQGDWNGFSNVFMYTVENVEGGMESYFIAPVADDDGEIENLLAVTIGVAKVDDEATAMQRDDLISAVVDTLKVDD